MDILLVIFLIVIGAVLLVAELFLLPGFGVAGIAGFVSLLASVLIAYFEISPMAGHITLCLSLLFTILAIYIFLKSKAIDKMALDTKIDSSVDLAAPGKKIEKLEQEASAEE